MIKKKAADSIKAVVDAIFERAKSRLLGRHSNRLYIQIVKDFGVTNSIEYLATEAAKLSGGINSDPPSELIEAKNEEASLLLDSLKARATIQIMDAARSGDKDQIITAMEKVTQSFETIASEELNSSQALGLLGTIDQISSDRNISDPTLIWFGQNDDRQCKWCKKMYAVEGNLNKPRAWKRSQLSMAYFKPKEWDGNTVHMKAHPRCRHFMTILIKGFGLSDDGKIKYISKDHDEYQAQKAAGQN